MDRYDDRNEAVLRAVLEVCAPDADAETLPYEEVLKRLQALVLEQAGQAAEAKPPIIDTPDKAQAVRQAIGRLDPHAEDQYLDDEALLPRFAAMVDKELFRWTSSLVQPPGPSGDTAVAPTPASEELQASRV